MDNTSLVAIRLLHRPALPVLLAMFILKGHVALAAPDISKIAFHPVLLHGDFSMASRDGTNVPARFPGIDESTTGEAYRQPSIEEYRASIMELETSGGPFNPAIGQQAESLGDLLLQSGNPEEAVIAYEKSLHVTRVNEGLNSPSQEGLLRKLVKSELAASNPRRAHEMHESLLYLQKRIHRKGEQGYISAIVEWADWNVELLRLEEAAMTGRESGPVVLINNNLITAQENYIEAIEQIHASPDPSADADRLLIHSEKKLAAINYMANSRSNLYRAPYSAMQKTHDAFAGNPAERSQAAYFFNGSSALKRAIAWSLESPQPDYLSIAGQMMTLGDWYLLFDRRAAALSIYGDAYEVLRAVEATEDQIAQIMTPGMPVTTPDLAPAGQEDAATAYIGYIDVEFSVSKFGIATRPEVIGGSEHDASPVTQALIRRIRQERFRPAFIDGTAANSENVKLRYYYSFN